MKSIISLLLSFSLSISYANTWDDPNRAFDATTNRVHNGSISIEWRLADDINKACDEFSRQHGNKGFGKQNIQGCAFWWGPTCVIITKKKPTMHTVGHEIRHCFYGQWH